MKNFLYLSLLLLTTGFLAGCTTTTSSSGGNATELEIAVGESATAGGYTVKIEKIMDSYDGWDDIDEKDVVGPGVDLEVDTENSSSMMSMAEGARSYLDIPEDGKETDYIKLVKVDQENQKVTVAITMAAN